MLRAQLMTYVNKTVKVYLKNGEMRQGKLFLHLHYDCIKGEIGTPRFVSIDNNWRQHFVAGDVRSITVIKGD